MSIISRYINREILLTTAAITFVLLTITIFSQLDSYLHDILRGKLPKEFLLLMIFYSLPRFLELLLPLCFFLGVLLTFGRLYAESEMSVISACGSSALQMAKIVMIPALLITLVVGFVSLYLAPYSMAKVYNMLVNPENYRNFNLRSEGKMQTNSGGRGVSHVGKIDRKTNEMRYVFISEIQPKAGRTEFFVMLADSGEMTDRPSGKRYIDFRDGHYYRGTIGSRKIEEVKFDQLSRLIADNDSLIYRAKEEGISTQRLLASDDPKLQATFHWRIALPLLVPSLAIIALALSKTNPRRGRYMGLFPAIVVFLVYLILLNSMRSVLANGELPMAFGMWGIHLIFATIACVMLVRMNGGLQRRTAKNASATLDSQGAQRS